ncbi:MAG: hypothetical protein GEV07_01610 [Streptosporangiales bacterium]|nr:hypothetical protein [Streptosporangiales bacterium]
MIGTSKDLEAEIRKRDVYPDFVVEQIQDMVAGESMRDWFCWHRARPGAGGSTAQVLIFALTESRFLYLNADNTPHRGQSCWSTGVAGVPLRNVTSVVSRSRRYPANGDGKPDVPDVAYLLVSWNSDKKLNATPDDGRFSGSLRRATR